ncbi:hypothetical protein SK128_022178 [Halocaridina rubra]|uniref:Immunoglobulin I-set domain-containing protein n=1 Tax=Halocaridina rubra TaxID=373956 RepID=A0AAN9AAT2_HALRR
MTLKIRRLTSADFGRYTCLISNSEGEASYTTTLREIKTTTVPPPPPTTTKKTTTALASTSAATFEPNILSTSTSVKTYNNYYDETVNLSAPLIINLTPDGRREDGNGCNGILDGSAGKVLLKILLSIISAVMMSILM